MHDNGTVWNATSANELFGCLASEGKELSRQIVMQSERAHQAYGRLSPSLNGETKSSGSKKCNVG